MQAACNNTRGLVQASSIDYRESLHHSAFWMCNRSHKKQLSPLFRGFFLIYAWVVVRQYSTPQADFSGTEDDRHPPVGFSVVLRPPPAAMDGYSGIFWRNLQFSRRQRFVNQPLTSDCLKGWCRTLNVSPASLAAATGIPLSLLTKYLHGMSIAYEFHRCFK